MNSSFSLTNAVIILSLLCCIFIHMVGTSAFSPYSRECCNTYLPGRGVYDLQQNRNAFFPTTTLSTRRKKKQTNFFLFSFFHSENDSNSNSNESGKNDDNEKKLQKNSHEEEKGRRQSEFNIEDAMENLNMQSYQKRLKQEKELLNSFATYGNELWQLRSTLVHLSKQLIQSIANNGSSDGSNSKSSSINSVVSEDELREMIREVELKDPEYVYALEKERLEKAIKELRMEDALKHKKRANAARSVLPQFNLHGLWIGK